MFWQSLVVAEIFKFPMLNWFSKKKNLTAMPMKGSRNFKAKKICQQAGI
jgi:hypothetical protein